MLHRRTTVQILTAMDDVNFLQRNTINTTTLCTAITSNITSNDQQTRFAVDTFI